MVPTTNLQKYYYFAYGMNTDPRAMKHYEYCVPICAGTLPGFHLTFRQFANVERGGSVMGAIWQIDQLTLKGLDMREGFPEMYGRQFCSIQGEDGKTYRAYVYLMNSKYVRMAKGYSPSRSYIKMLATGYTEFGIPIDQIRKGLRDSEVSIAESINLDVFKRGFEESTPFGEYELVAKTGQLPYVPGSKAKESSQFRVEAKLGPMVVGWVNFEINDNGFGTRNQALTALDLYVDRGHRGKGIATAMYKFARSLGNDIKPSAMQTTMGKQFWKGSKELSEVKMKAHKVYKVGTTGEAIMPKLEKMAKAFWGKSFPEVEIEYWKSGPKVWTFSLAHRHLDFDLQIQSDTSELMYMARQFDDVEKVEPGDASGWFPDVDKFQHVLPWITIEVTCK